MMRARLAWVMAAALAGCAAQDGAIQVVEPELPPGYPPQIGTVSADLGGTARNWDTFDYSIGAFDASVQVLDFNGQTQFRLMGETPGKPDLNENRLVMKAVMRNPTQTGKLKDVVIEIVAGKEWDGRRLTSIGSDTTLTLTSLTSPGPDGGYGHVKGQFTTTLCPADGQPPQIDRSTCQPFSGSFDSDLQISGR